MKCVLTLHPSFIQRNNWPLLAALRRNLELAKRESWNPELNTPPTKYILNPTVAQAREVCRVGDTRPFVFDIETVRKTGELICVGISRAD